MTRDEWRLLRYWLLAAFLMALVLVPILLHNQNFSKSVAQGILGAIALAVFAVQVHGATQEIKLSYYSLDTLTNLLNFE
jgi:lipopolysaccharide export LptBFGC system permease protein LptF